MSNKNVCDTLVRSLSLVINQMQRLVLYDESVQELIQNVKNFQSDILSFIKSNYSNEISSTSHQWTEISAKINIIISKVLTIPLNELIIFNTNAVKAILKKLYSSPPSIPSAKADHLRAFRLSSKSLKQIENLVNESDRHSSIALVKKFISNLDSLCDPLFRYAHLGKAERPVLLSDCRSFMNQILLLLQKGHEALQLPSEYQSISLLLDQFCSTPKKRNSSKPETVQYYGHDTPIANHHYILNKSSHPQTEMHIRESNDLERFRFIFRDTLSLSAAITRLQSGDVTNINSELASADHAITAQLEKVQADLEKALQNIQQNKRSSERLRGIHLYGNSSIAYFQNELARLSKLQAPMKKAIEETKSEGIKIQTLMSENSMLKHEVKQCRESLSMLMVDSKEVSRIPKNELLRECQKLADEYQRLNIGNRQEKKKRLSILQKLDVYQQRIEMMRDAIAKSHGSKMTPIDGTRIERTKVEAKIQELLQRQKLLYQQLLE